MPPDVHLHPDRLAAHALTAAALSDELLAALRSAPEAATPAEERVLLAVRRAARELSVLGSALAGAVSDHEAADGHAARQFDGLRP